jgi:hypothetical protein
MEKACVDSGMWHQKQKNMVKTIFSNRDIGIKKGHCLVLWVVEDNYFTTMSSQG